MTPLKLMSFQQHRICCNDLSVLSTVITNKIYSEFEHVFVERLCLLKELKMHNNEKVKNECFAVISIQENNPVILQNEVKPKQINSPSNEKKYIYSVSYRNSTQNKKKNVEDPEKF